jgi:hypothetical protein
MAGPPSQTWVTDNCTREAYKPSSIVLNCADFGKVLSRLHWSSWTTTKAMGNGYLTIKQCVPNCATGGRGSYIAKRVVLSKPGKCYKQSHLAFKQASVTYKAKKPNGKTLVLNMKLFCPIPKSNGGP